MAITEKNRSYSAAHFGLELDGKADGGLFRSVEGGSIKLDVMSYQRGGDYHHAKQLGKPKFDDIKLQVGMSMSDMFFEWIAYFFSGKAVRKNGAIIAADFYYKERARREFTNALVKEMTFPKLDGSDKNAAYLSVTLAVETLKFVAGTGGDFSPPMAFGRQRLWTACDFDFVLSGFDCKEVSKVDSFTVKQTIVEYHMGGQLSPTKTPSEIDFPNIVFYIPESKSQQFSDHLTNNNGIAYKNNVATSSPLNGSITSYDNSRKNLFSLTFTGADIVSVTPDKSDSSSEEIKLVKVELYTQGMTFKFGSSGG